MIRITLILLLISLFSPFGWVFQSMDNPEITSPQDGEVLQGSVIISGSSQIEGFQSADIAFAYDADATSSWFLLNESLEPIEGGELTIWDTTIISDGNYRLRLSVKLEDGTVRETLIRGLRIRNYSLIETATPEPVMLVIAETSTPVIATRTPISPPAELPPNPVLVTHQMIQATVVQGIFITLVVFGVVGIYLALKKLIQRS
jgi:hypothetical protein